MSWSPRSPDAGGSPVDPEVFERLVGEIGPRVHGYLRRRAPAAADDLHNEVWLAAFTARRSYRPEAGDVGGWVFGIARNVLHTHLRRSRPTLSLDAVEPHGEQSAERTADDEWAAVDRRLDAAGLAPALRSVVAELPAAERDVLLLIAWEQLTPTEAAAALGIPAGTARSRLHRARARIDAAWDHARHDTEVVR